MIDDEQLTEAEGIWRQAALERRAQIGVDMNGTGAPTCAAMILSWWCQLLPLGRLTGWICPLCGVRYGGGAVGIPIVHLNDGHKWDWLTFANKFRDIMAEGERLAR